MGARLQGRIGGSLWTGPLLDNISMADGKMVLQMQEWSAVGLAFKDVPNCIDCCKHYRPFQISVDDAVSWQNAEATIDGARVELTMPGINNTGPIVHVRYAWADFVDCVMVNNDRCGAV